MCGYTIYYKTRKKVSKEEVAECVEAIKEIIEENKEIVVIDYPDEVNKYNINFNGFGDEGHETFCFDSNYKEDIREEIIDNLEDVKQKDSGVIFNGELGFCFCKTARKKYDKVCKLALIKIQEITNNKFEISCDDGYSYEKTGIYKTKYSKDVGSRGEFVTNNLNDLAKDYDWGEE